MKGQITSGSTQAGSTLKGFLFLSSCDIDIERFDFNVTARSNPASGFTLIANAAADPVDGFIVRYTASDTNFMGSGSYQVSASMRKRSPIGVYAAVRMNQTTASWVLYAQVSGSAMTASLKTLEKVISGTSVSPQAIAVGTISTPQDMDVIKFFVKSSEGSGTCNPTFDLGYAFLHAYDSPTSRAIAIENARFDPNSALIHIDTGPASLLTPNVGSGSNTGCIVRPARSYEGDAYVVGTQNALYGALMAPAGSYWRQTTPAGSTISNSLSADRYPGHTYPE